MSNLGEVTSVLYGKTTALTQRHKLFFIPAKSYFLYVYLLPTDQLTEKNICRAGESVGMGVSIPPTLTLVTNTCILIETPTDTCTANKS